MNFLKSIIYGSEGSYDFLGVPVKFEKMETHYSFSNKQKKSSLSKSIACLADLCVTSKSFAILTGGYTHCLIHEYGHAFTCKLLKRHVCGIRISSNSALGRTSMLCNTLPSYQKSIIDTAGPFLGISYSCCKLISALALKKYISRPVAFSIAAGALIWILGEIFYALFSVIKKDGGDFGQIAKRGKVHVIAATGALLVPTTIGLTVGFKLLMK